MTAGFALVGIARPDALLIAVLFGLISMVAALPGAILWLGGWRIGGADEQGTHHNPS